MDRLAKPVLAVAALMVFLTAFEVRQPIVSMGPIGFTTSELSAIFFLAILTVWALRHRLRLFSRRALDAAVIIFVTSNFLSAAFASDKPSAFKFSMRMTLAALVYFGISRLPSRTRSHLVVAGAVTASLLAVTLVGLLENFTQLAYWPQVLSPWQERAATFGAFYNVRVSATLPFPTVLSMYIEMAVPLVLALVLCIFARRGISAPKGRGRNLLIPLIIIAGLAAVMLVQILTFTRTALAATFVSMIIGAGLAYVFGYGRKITAYLALGAAILLTLLAGSVAVSDRMATRLGVASEVKSYGAQYKVLEFPQNLKSGQEYTARLRIKNTSDFIWTREGEGGVILLYRWSDYPSKEPHAVDFITTELPGDVGPGEEIDAALSFKTPDEPGRYVLIMEPAKLGVGWFSSKSNVPPVAIALEINSAGSRTIAVEEDSDSPIWADAAESVPSRSKLWRAAVNMWKEHPVLGVGPGQYRKLYSQYMPGIQANERLETHNIFLEALANTGVLGLAAMVWLIAGAALIQLKLIRDRQLRPDIRLIALGLLMALVAYVSHGILDFFLWQTGIAFMFFIQLGLTSWLYERAFRGHNIN